ncbi:hypothetical protein AHAS_Ahas09G0143700 [Arachis hypogaea]
MQFVILHLEGQSQTRTEPIRDQARRSEEPSQLHGKIQQSMSGYTKSTNRSSHCGTHQRPKRRTFQPLNIQEVPNISNQGSRKGGKIYQYGGELPIGRQLKNRILLTHQGTRIKSPSKKKINLGRSLENTTTTPTPSGFSCGCLPRNMQH